ncbi:polysaccharide deacetylase family protein [Facilibium subflavum]|uniref:polysaccharide deacetylase family protein n=1 Tax=Facilibium subflavum TaxID=2219058 RepID=UPI000E64D88D|nr:polysaccharide deacetylase family protein [Facilibium subflavum]
MPAKSIPVLMYHHVLPQSGFITSSIDQFKQQMQWLKDNEYSTLSADAFYAFKFKQAKLPKKSVLITFDDGWKDNLIYAYPILKQYGFKAILFVITSWVDKASNKDHTSQEQKFGDYTHKTCMEKLLLAPEKVVLSWDELRSMQDVFDIQAHTHTHREAIYEEIPSWEDDIQQSKMLITKKLGKVPRHLCWPKGMYDKQSIEVASAYGFDILYTTKRGVNLADNNGEEIKRFAVKNDAKWLAKTVQRFQRPFWGKIYSLMKPG